MLKTSHDFIIILSLDGSRAVEDYIGRPDSSHFNTMTLLEFAWQYSMLNTLGAQSTPRSRRIVVIPQPYISPDPPGGKYEQDRRQSLMQHKPFCQMDDLLSGYDTYINAYTAFLQLTRSLPVSRMSSSTLT